MTTPHQPLGGHAITRALAKAGALTEARRVATALRAPATLEQVDRDYAANIIDKLAQWVEDWHGLAVVAEHHWTLKGEALKDLLRQIEACDGTAQLDTDRALKALAGQPRMEAETAEYSKLHKDAERYRWLRAQHWDTSPLCVVCDPKDAVKLGRTCPSGDYLDLAIDDAMLIGRAVGTA